jgi:hypothetical protein|tara:strand:+ start:4583 stop:4687 length:105 start_codon:yes stop_codon:yes gene_type:complete
MAASFLSMLADVVSKSLNDSGMENDNHFDLELDF